MSGFDLLFMLAVSFFSCCTFLWNFYQFRVARARSNEYTWAEIAVLFAAATVPTLTILPLPLLARADLLSNAIEQLAVLTMLLLFQWKLSAYIFRHAPTRGG